MVCALKGSDQGVGLSFGEMLRLVLTIQETRLVRSRLTGKPEGGGVTLLWTGIFLGKEEIAIISALARMSVLPETTP